MVKYSVFLLQFIQNVQAVSAAVSVSFNVLQESVF